MTALHIGIPTLDGRLEHACLVGLLATYASRPCRLTLARGSILAHNRDLICAEFLSGDASHLLCVDADMAWTPADVDALLALDVDFAFGFYGTKTIPSRLMCSPPRMDLPEYDACGAGFVLLSRACVERMTEAHRAESYRDGQGRTLVPLWQTPGTVVREDGTRVLEGEDYAFCRRWRALGGRIYGHPGVVLGHVGPYVYRPTEAARRKSAGRDLSVEWRARVRAHDLAHRRREESLARAVDRAAALDLEENMIESQWSEETLWDAVMGDCEHITAEEAAHLRSLAERAGGWWTWRDAEGADMPAGLFVPIAEWEAYR